MSVSKHQADQDLEETVREARALAEKLGLDGYPVKYWVVEYDTMNELIAYDGFPTRYPHWRWGMKYNQQQKQDRYGAHRAFEIVINDDPSHAYLQESNTLTDQKTVIAHVEAHVDFFKNNRWYQMIGDIDSAVGMFERHAKRIEGFIEDPEIDREEVERFIDSAVSIVDTIDQHRPFTQPAAVEKQEKEEAEDSPVEGLGFSDDVRDAVFSDEWEQRVAGIESEDEPVRDLLAFLSVHGKQFDADAERAVEREDWQNEILDILRKEAYYFAPQKMTRVMNEGFAAFFESLMMSEEAFAGPDEFVHYADHHSQVLGSPGLNPYKLGKELWEYIENVENRREVIEQLLRVEGVTVENFHDTIDFARVHDLLEPTPPLDAIMDATLADLEGLDASKIDPEALDRARSGVFDVDRYPWKVLSYEGLAERHFSLRKPRNRGFLREISQRDLEQTARYIFDTDRYASIEDAIQHVDYTAGWDKIFEVRESHNDVTFLDEFLTPAFVQQNDYFTYEYSVATDEFRVASTDPADVKKKLLLKFANFGKPTITVHDGNYNNRNELLLAHHYNGIQLDLEDAGETLKRVFDLWGRPVCLKTIVKELDEKKKRRAERSGVEPTPEEQGKLLRYDGEQLTIENLHWEEVEDIAASDIDYATKPDEWM